jgi:ParB-like chromosome segregation protein Spo0J
MAKTTGLASIAEGRSDIHKIDPRKLRVRENWNSRDFSLQENIDHVEWLAGNIAKLGVKEPLTIFWDKGVAYVDNGECRLRACMLAIERGVDIHTVPCKIATPHSNEADRLFDQWLANTGKQFNSLELARHFKHMLDLGWSQQDIAEKAGTTQGWVSQVLAVLKASVAVQKMIGNGEVAPSLAMQIVRDEGAGAEKILKDGLEAAKKAGGTKVKGEHVGKLNIKTVVTDAFEFSDIDDSAKNVCIITMPMKKWNVIRDILKL